MKSRFGLKAAILALMAVCFCASGQAATAYNSTVWNADLVADGVGSGTLNGTNTVTYTSTAVSNAGITFDTSSFPPNWNASPATNGGGTLTYSSTLAGVLGTSGGSDVQRITFSSNITNPVLLVDFAAPGTVITFANPYTLLSVNNCIGIPTSITCPAAGRTASDGFAARIMGTFGPGTPLIFTYADTRGPNTIGFSIASLPPPTIAKTFTPSSIQVGNNSTLTFTITNPNATALTGVAFSDTLPGGLVVANPSNASSNCGGTVTAASGSSTISLANGTVAANASCTISVDVTATTAGAKVNTTSQVTSNEADNGIAASATLTAVAPPFILKAFADSTIEFMFSGTTLFFRISNPNSTALTGIAVTDVLPAGLTIATPSGANIGTCAGATLTAPAGGNTITFSNGTLAGGAVCIFAVQVLGTDIGTFTNTSGNVTAISGNLALTGNTATDRITVDPLFFFWFFHESGGGSRLQ